MGVLIRLNRVLLVLGIVFAFMGTAFAQEGPDDQPSVWQNIITGQIEAFRAGDAETAMTYAGSKFKLAYRDADIFFDVIKNSGYAAILDSRSHSFGKYKREDKIVLQVVRFKGPNQFLYEAIYTMGDEEEGWRVQGVILRKSSDISV